MNVMFFFTWLCIFKKWIYKREIKMDRIDHVRFYSKVGNESKIVF